jgi:hypothetical protein
MLIRFGHRNLSSSLHIEIAYDGLQRSFRGDLSVRVLGGGEGSHSCYSCAS